MELYMRSMLLYRHVQRLWNCTEMCSMVWAVFGLHIETYSQARVPSANASTLEQGQVSLVAVIAGALSSVRMQFALSQVHLTQNGYSHCEHKAHCFLTELLNRMGVAMLHEVNL